MRVCYFGTYRKEYNRNKIMIASMKAVGIEVIECHEKLWESIEDRVNVTKGGWLNPKFWLRVVRTYSRLIKRFKSIGDFDVLMTGHPGQFDIFLAYYFSRQRNKPLVSDVLMSLYAVIVHERHLDKTVFSAVNFIKFFEKIAYRKPALMTHETPAYARWISEHFNVPISKFRLVPTGADERIFKPCLHKNPQKLGFTVLYYGTFIPNHGLDLVLDAAKILENEEELKFLFIGEGPEKEKVVKRVEELGLKNVEFIGWVNQQELVEHIHEADLCLGAFGVTLHSMITVHNKVYESMACGKAFVTGVSPAIQEQFVNREEILYCERSSEAIADSILEIMHNEGLQHKLETDGRKRFVRDYSFEAQGNLLKEYLEEAVNSFSV